jgi:hypothetical protein
MEIILVIVGVVFLRNGMFHCHTAPPGEAIKVNGV